MKTLEIDAANVFIYLNLDFSNHKEKGMYTFCIINMSMPNLLKYFVVCSNTTVYLIIYKYIHQ